MNGKFLRLILFSILPVFAWTGCSTVKISVDRMYPPVYDIPAGKRLAVIDFQSAYSNPQSGSRVANSLVAALARSGYYQMVERSQIRSVIQEQKFADSFYVDARKVDQFGKILDLDYLVVGEVQAYEIEEERTVVQEFVTVLTGDFQRDAYGNVVYITDAYGNSAPIPETRTEAVDVPVLVKRATVASTFRMNNVETGEIVVSDRFTDSWNDRAKGTAEIGRMPANESLLSDLTENVVNQFVKLIATHSVREMRVLEKGKSKLSKYGATLARNNRWNEAIETWKRAQAETPDDPAIYNNLGLAYEIQNDFDQADEYYRRALELRPGRKRYMQNLNQIDHLRKAYRSGK